MFGKYAKGGLRSPEDYFAPMAPVPVLRPCLVDGKPATFHRWADVDRALLKIDVFVRPDEQDRLVRAFRNNSVVPQCCSTEVVRMTLALVEYPDGSVGMVKPELVTFIDRKEG